MRRLLIVDPTLASLQGHSYNYDRAVGEAARAHFDDVTIYADRGFRAPAGDRLRYETVLNRWPLDALKGRVNRAFHALARLRGKLPAHDAAAGAHATLVPNVWHWLIRLAQWLRAREFASSLNQILQAQTHDGEIHVLLQHARIDELIAIGQLCAQPAARAGTVHLDLILRDSPGLVNNGRYGEARFAELLVGLARAREFRVHLFTDSERLTREYLALGVAAVGTLPVPVVDLAPGAPRAESGELGVAFLGPARVEKGFCELARLVESLPRSAAARRVCAMVQVTRASADPRIRHALAELEQLAGSLPRGALELLDSPAPPPQYYAWLARAGIVVLPYVSRKYSSSTSGIFVEAICCGVPVLCPADSWMSDVIEAALRDHGRRIGEAFTRLEQIPRLVERIAGELARYRADVDVFAKLWRARHNPRTWVETLLAEAK